MTAIALTIIIVAGILVISLPRQHALKPLISGITLIPMGSVIYIGPANFHPMRILVLFGMLRAILRGEKINGKLNSIDKCVLLWSIIMLITGALQPKLDTTFITRLGEVYDALGLYFIMRFLIKEEKDIHSIIKTLSVVFAVIMVFMVYERLKCFNLFSLLGGIGSFPANRDGKIRCQGPFAHSILTGTVAATSIALFILSFKNLKIGKKFSYTGILASTTIVFLTSSSGPLMSLMFSIIGLFFWHLRNNMKTLLYCLLGTLVALQIVMESPIWFLIAKIDLTGSSTGYHRSALIDSAIRHFNEWWFIGTTYTRHWMPTGVSWSQYHTDITNQYIKNGIAGGLGAMLLFVFMIVNGFVILGRALCNLPDSEVTSKLLIWSLGVSLFSHSVTFLSVRYFDQSMMYFYLTIAMIGCVDYIHSSRKTLSIESKAKESSKI